MKKKGKVRLTITLNKELLPLIDKTIDGEKIRNRSHAIEYILGQNLGTSIKKAVILAGGEGIKMRPFTYEMPKTMILVKGKPILEYIVRSLAKYGITDLTILTGNHGDMIEKYFSDGSKFGVKIRFVVERKKWGTGGALKQTDQYINDAFILIYGDVLADINYHDFIEFHQEKNSQATVALTSIADPEEFGVVRLHGSKIVDFVEKPSKDPSLSRLISAGIFIIEPEMLNMIPKKGHSSLERDVLPKIAAKEELYGYPFSGQWFDVSTPEIYERVIKDWKQK